MNTSIYLLVRKAEHPLIWYLLSFFFIVLYYFIEHEGFYYLDDYSYSLFAYQLLKGTFQLDNYVFCHRFMVFAPVSLIYWLGGVNTYTTTAWPLISSLGTLTLIYVSLRKEHPAAAAWAMVLFGFYYFQLNTVSYLYPDNIIMFLTTCCLAILFRVRKQLTFTRAQIFWGVLFALVNLMAFLAKETIVYAAPFYFLLLIYQIKHTINLKFWAAATISGIVFLLIYFLLYKIFTGNAFLRFQDIEEAGAAVTSPDFFENRASLLATRLSYQPLLALIGSGLAVPFGFALIGILTFKTKKLYQLSSPYSFWMVASITMLFCIWFGSVSLDYYKPMYLQPRMSHPMVPAFCLAAGFALEASWNSVKTYLCAGLLFLLCSFLGGGKMWIIYLPISIGFIGLFLYKKQVSTSVGLFIVMVALSTRPIYFMLKPTVFDYKAQETLMNNHLQHAVGNYTVLTDTMMLKRYPYFYGFEVPTNYSYQNFSSFNQVHNKAKDTVFLLINNAMLEHPDLMISLREKDILPNFPTAQLLDQKGKVKLFVIPPKQ